MSKKAALIRKRLLEYQEKPLLPAELPNILLKLKAPNCSTESFRLQYKQDPVFCWLLIEQGWLATQKRNNHPFAADHAMSIIGVSGAERLFSRFQSRASNSTNSTEVMFNLSCSLLAAELAHQIGSLHSQNNQRYWLALNYLMPETLLWHMHPRSMWHIYYRQITLPKKITLFEEAKLGFSLQEWKGAVTETFHLGDQCRLLFEKELPRRPAELVTYSREGLSKATPSLEAWHGQEFWLIVLANRLAKAIVTPWHSRSIQHSFNMLKQTTGCESRKLQLAINASIRSVSINLQGSSLPNPGVAYLLRRNRPFFPEWLIKPQIAESVLKRKAVAKPITNSQNQKWQNLSVIISRLVKQPDQFNSSAHLVNTGLNALIDELKFSRVAFLAVNHREKTAVTKIALTTDKKTKIRPDFEFKQPTVLSKFVAEQAFMLFTRNKHQKIWRQLPIAVQKDNIDRFVLCSLKPGKQIRAIIYADGSDPNSFTSEYLTQAKKVLQAINKGLALRNQAKQTLPSKTN